MHNKSWLGNRDKAGCFPKDLLVFNIYWHGASTLNVLQKMIESHLAERKLDQLGFYHRFQDAQWKNRASEVKQMGLVIPEDFQFVEVDRGVAIDRLSMCLSQDLCYGSRSGPTSGARELAEWFVSSFHFQSRFLTNSPEGFHPSGVWSFSPLCPEATMDTGLIVRTGRELVGLMWVASID